MDGVLESLISTMQSKFYWCVKRFHGVTELNVVHCREKHPVSNTMAAFLSQEAKTSHKRERETRACDLWQKRQSYVHNYKVPCWTGFKKGICLEGFLTFG